MNVIKSFLLPPGIFILIFAAAFLQMRKPAAGRIIFALAALLLFYLSTTPFVGGNMLRTLEHVPVIDSQSLGEVDAILVLSAGVQRYAPEYGGITTDGLMLERLRYAARLQRETRLPVFVTGGLAPGGGGALADIMADVLREDFAIEVAGRESLSATTFENAAFSASMLAEHGVHRVALVTHAWHMPRAVASFRDAGVDVVPAPMGFTEPIGFVTVQLLPSMRAFARTYYALHEWLGIGWYRLTKFHLTVAEAK